MSGNFYWFIPPCSPSPTAKYFYLFSWPSVLLSCLLPYLILTLYSLSHRSITFSMSSVIFLFSLLSGIEAFTLWLSFLLSVIWSVRCTVGILSFWANIHLSMNLFHPSTMGVSGNCVIRFGDKFSYCLTEPDLILIESHHHSF